jgi:hypothetical protein
MLALHASLLDLLGTALTESDIHAVWYAEDHLCANAWLT